MSSTQQTIPENILASPTCSEPSSDRTVHATRLGDGGSFLIPAATPREYTLHGGAAVTTRFIAHYGDGPMSATITPPATITHGEDTMRFELRFLDAPNATSHAPKPAHPTAGQVMHTLTYILENDVKSTTCHKEVTAKCAEHDVEGFNRDCEIQKCIWDHLKPMNITTAYPDFLTSANGGVYLGYVAEVTRLSNEPHWGTTDPAYTYYPMDYITSVDASGCMNITATRAPHPPAQYSEAYSSVIRTMVSGKRHTQTVTFTGLPVAPDPECWNNKTCHRVCAAKVDVQHENGLFEHQVLVAASIPAGIVAAFLIFGAIFFCFCRRHIRRMRLEKEEREGNSVAGGRAVGQVAEANHSATGVDAVTTGSAGDPGSAAATANPKAKNVGTLGRQAEEGRGHVSTTGTPAAAATAAGTGVAGSRTGEKSANPAVVTSDKITEKPADHVEHAELVTPVAVHDGAESRRTGSNMGSTMRGRRPNKHEEA